MARLYGEAGCTARHPIFEVGPSKPSSESFARVTIFQISLSTEHIVILKFLKSQIWIANSLDILLILFVHSTRMRCH